VKLQIEGGVENDEDFDLLMPFLSLIRMIIRRLFCRRRGCLESGGSLCLGSGARLDLAPCIYSYLAPIEI
jgi:hypothetical protein